MVFVPPLDMHYCLDPWCENPDPELIPEALCGCHILTEAEIEERKRKYLAQQGRHRADGQETVLKVR
ncbi:hypothetical protein STHAL_32470 [Streptomyces halstedii]|uniref:Uncharacterized protein n=1 Tax=Streptomyces halstedii TaxID=1944 RepID=A0ABS6U0U1_STRHA|nr:hypothetical protein [Streptomyces halstedii]MBV7674164.1 hypothetical protein [Streptomyces halstedii]